MNPNVAPETQFVGQPAPEVPPQPSFAGIPSAEAPQQPFTITGPAQPIQQEAPAPIPPEFLQHSAPEAPAPGQFAPSQPAPEALAQPTVQPGPEAVPPPPPIAEVPPIPTVQPSPSVAPWTETMPPLPTEPVVGLSPDATAALTPTPQTPTEAAVLQSMEPGNADLIANNREPLGVAIAEAAQAETLTPKIPVTELLSNSDKKDIIPAPIEEVIENGKKGLSLVEGTKLEGPFLEGFAGGVAISTGYKKAA
jgi:hypothetical protein